MLSSNRVETNQAHCDQAEFNWWLSFMCMCVCVYGVAVTQCAARVPDAHLRGSELSSLYYVKLIRRWKKR